MTHADCGLSSFRHSSKYLRGCTHLILPAKAEKQTIIGVHFVDEKTEAKRD